MDLPNYSRQLLQQLGALRKEGQFCDCTIVVGSTSHPAHKVALAASSLLFRSLLAGSDSISIDTAVVTPPEFSCLLDMVYTGRLPPGQHNLTRMIAAADSLQMFDVAVGCKNVLTSLMGPSDAALAEAEGQKDATAAEVVGQEACAGSAESVEKSGSGFEGSHCSMRVSHCRSLCGGSVHEALQRVLSRDVELALPLCQLLCASLQSVPGLQPLVEDMKRMDVYSFSNWPCVSEEDAPCSAADGESPQHASCRDYSCQWCGKAFRFKCRLATHVKRCGLSAETQRRCTRCGDEFPTPRSLQQHAARAHDCPARKRKKQGPVTCDLCSKTFAHSSGMQYHKRTEHFEEKPYPCTECGAKFAAKSSLKNHARLHTGEKPFRCKHCDMSFSVAAALSYHTKKKHSEGKMYACQYCDAVFAQSIELTRHVRTHTGDKPYVCRQCGKGFSQANGLSVHLQNFHTEPHDCQRCRMSFSSLEEHQSHLRDVHSEEFNQCGDCSKVFSSAVLLEKHRATHAGTKPHHCSLCNKSYQQLSGLWYHNRTTHPEVFASQSAKTLRSLSQCRVCNKAFASDGSLLKHQRAEHADLPQRSCPLCPAAFPTDAGLQQHVVAQHGAVQEHAREEAESAPSTSRRRTCHGRTLCLCAVQVVEEERCPGEGAEQQVIALDQSQLGGSQQLFVALGEGQDTPSGSGIVAVSVEDLLDGTVTLICEERR
uniref:Zinc finger and BTB domain containing 40 n=1 Tax=Denticeps clupeoides TaxID=299321 RepID=A0AAY4CYN8_9TELE